MVHISESLDEVMVNILFNQMTNPDNPDFYIEKLTIGDIQTMLKDMRAIGESSVEIFWTAFRRAQKFLQFKKLLEL